MRGERDKEKTKMRERERRANTTKIFPGLRKHSGYQLPSRADINQVLRHLATEAGWVIEPDGTTYRPSAPVQAGNRCSLCSCIRGTSAIPTPTSSIVDCSAPPSPRNMPLQESAAVHADRLNQLYLQQQRASLAERTGGLASASMQTNKTSSAEQFPAVFYMISRSQPHQPPCLQNVRACSERTTLQSP